MSLIVNLVICLLMEYQNNTMIRSQSVNFVYMNKSQCGIVKPQKEFHIYPFVLTAFLNVMLKKKQTQSLININYGNPIQWQLRRLIYGKSLSNRNLLTLNLTQLRLPQTLKNLRKKRIIILRSLASGNIMSTI